MKHYFRIIGIVIFCTTFCWGAHVEVKNVTAEIQSRLSPLLSTSSPSLSECSCNENNNVDPVCGSDGTTYVNLQQLECFKKCQPVLEYLYDGPCLGGNSLGQPATAVSHGGGSFGQSQKPCLCDIDMNEKYELYCGTDGYTYPYKSWMDCKTKCQDKSLSVHHRGPCKGDEYKYFKVLRQESKPPCICTMPFLPSQRTCGSNGRTYPGTTYIFCRNMCSNTNIREKHPGKCKIELFEKQLSFMDFLTKYKPHIYRRLNGSERACVEKCPATINNSPTCGTDGVTYENPLQIDCARNCYDPDLNVENEGPCLYI